MANAMSIYRCVKATDEAVSASDESAENEGSSHSSCLGWIHAEAEVVSPSLATLRRSLPVLLKIHVRG